MNESQAGADFSRYILDRMRQLEERNLALREQRTAWKARRGSLRIKNSSLSERPQTPQRAGALARRSHDRGHHSRCSG